MHVPLLQMFPIAPILFSDITGRLQALIHGCFFQTDRNGGGAP